MSESTVSPPEVNLISARKARGLVRRARAAFVVAPFGGVVQVAKRRLLAGMKYVSGQVHVMLPGEGAVLFPKP
jgi:hypothetical protein